MNSEQYHQEKEDTGTQVRAICKARGLSRRELGELAGTNQTVVAKIEKGESQQPLVVEGLALALQ